jgi:4-alpha-glucanotransferase
MQDFLSLGDWARMNYPGTASGNWSWRMHPDAINQALVARLHETNLLYGRLPQTEKDAMRQSIMEDMQGQVLPH